MGQSARFWGYDFVAMLSVLVFCCRRLVDEMKDKFVVVWLKFAVVWLNAGLHRRWLAFLDQVIGA